MSVTSGFFNSLNGDRKYDAKQVSELFDGVIGDGVFMHVGEKLQVYSTNQANTVSVGTGRCWFNHVWVKNGPSRLPITLPAPDEVYNRWDAIIVEIKNANSDRKGSIKYVKGTAGSNPVKPTLLKNGGDTGTSQYALAYIYRRVNTTIISSSDIHTAVGFSETPWVVAPAGVVDLNKYWSDWEAQWSTWFNNIQDENETEFNEFLENKNQQYNQFEVDTMNEWQSLKSELDAQTTAAVNASQDAIDGTLAGQLQKQIDDLEFMNNMRPFQSITISDESDTPEFWYNMNSCYGKVTYESNGEFASTGMIENFVSPHSYIDSPESSSLSPDDKNGYYISQIMKFTTPNQSYIRTGYYRDSKYDETTTVDRETGWDIGDNSNGWIRVASYNEVSNKVNKSGDTMTGVLEIKRTESQTETGLKVTKTTNSGNAYEARLGVTPSGIVWVGNWHDGASVNTMLLHPDHTSLGQPLGTNSGGTGSTTAAGARANLSTFGAESIGGHWGITKPDGGNDVWVRTPKLGLLPYAQNIGCNLGSGGGWQFDKAFLNLIYPLKSSYSIADFVIASGSGGAAASTGTYANYWLYFKFNSGLCIIACTKLITTSATGSQWVGFNLPFNLVDIYSVLSAANVTESPETWMGYTIGVSNPGRIETYVCGIPFINKQCRVYATLIGKWK